MADIQGTRIKLVELPSGNYEIAARTILDGNIERNFDYIKDMVNQRFEKVISKDAATTPLGVEWKYGQQTIVGTLTAAKAVEQGHSGAIYLVPEEDVASGIYVEYVVVNEETTEDPNWKWEKIGSTRTDMSDYVEKDVYATSENGSHSHTATVSVNTYEGVTEALGITQTQQVTLDVNTTEVVGDIETNTVDVIGKDATIAINDGGVVASKLVTTTITPAKAGGTASLVTIGSDVGAASLVSLDSTDDPYDIAVAKSTVTPVASGALVDATAQTSGALLTNPVVSDDGVLSFSYCTLGTKNITEAVASTLPRVEITPVAIPTITATPVTVATVDTAVTVATGALATDGAGASVVTGHNTITATFDNKDVKSPLVSVTATPATVVSDVDVANQPAFGFARGVVGGLTVVTGIDKGEDETKNVTVAAAGSHSHSVDLT